MKPSVGSIVHYVSYGTPGGEYSRECRAAIITEVPAGVASPQTIGLCVLNPTGQFFNRTVPFGEGDLPCQANQLTGGTWHWPARVQ